MYLGFAMHDFLHDQKPFDNIYAVNRNKTLYWQPFDQGHSFFTQHTIIKLSLFPFLEEEKDLNCKSKKPLILYL